MTFPTVRLHSSLVSRLVAGDDPRSGLSFRMPATRVEAVDGSAAVTSFLTGELRHQMLDTVATAGEAVVS
jgi:hypothetical protein